MNLLPVYDLLPVRSVVRDVYRFLKLREFPVLPGEHSEVLLPEEHIPNNPPAVVLLSSQWAAAAVPGAVVLPEAQEPWSDIPAEAVPGVLPAEAVPGVLPAGEPVLLPYFAPVQAEVRMHIHYLHIRRFCLLLPRR